MKIVLLSGAYKNAGDFLIVHRCKELLQYCFPNCEISEFKRNVDLTDNLQEINASDCIFIGGGPAYTCDFYPGIIKMCQNLEDIHVPIIPLGLGWWGMTSNIEEIERCKFSSASRQLLDKMFKGVKALSCRDWESFHVLRQNGFEAVMTGCPAWYDISHVNEMQLRKNKSDYICISDPAVPKNRKILLQLIDYLVKRYPERKIRVIFHRGCGETDKYTGQKIAKSQQTLRAQLVARGCECLNIAYSHEGFHYYDDCFLHIGFRVHAHIYNLSKRQKSILIEEDSRGNGINYAVGLPGIKAYRNIPVANCRPYRIYMRKFNCNSNAVGELELLLNELEVNDQILYRGVFARMQEKFEVMTSYMKEIQGIL